jgi:hypothetical protein
VEFPYTIAGFVNLKCLSTTRIIGATRRPRVGSACIESNVAVTVSNAATRLVTEECDWGACIDTSRNSIGATGIHIAPGLLAPVVISVRPNDKKTEVVAD